MVKKHRVVLAYLETVTGSLELPPHMLSQEDKGKQTAAIEKMLKDLLNGPLSKYKDTVFAVGGSVRDQLLKRAPKDLDLMIDDPKLKLKAAEDFTKDLARQLNITTDQNPHALKEQYGIWGVILFSPERVGDRTFTTPDGTDVTGYQIEVAPSRKEGPRKGTKREPEWVDYTPRKDDAKRRDLTINAIYKNLATGKIEDYVGGVQDLNDKVLRPPEHPEGTRKIYEEDPLRIFRLIRFSGKLDDFKIDPETAQVASDYVNSPEGRADMKEVLSGERIRDELTQVLTHQDPQTAVRGMELMRKWNMLEFIAPEFDKLIDIMHDKVYHKGESVWQHTMNVLGRTQNNSLKARLGALFHDIGKLSTMEEAVDKEGRPRVHFIGHEDVGPEMVQRALGQLHFPGDVINSVSNIVHGHMAFRGYDGMKSESKLRRRFRLFIEKLYHDLDDAIAVMRADAGEDPNKSKRVDEIEQAIKKQKADDEQKGLIAPRGVSQQQYQQQVQEKGFQPIEPGKPVEYVYPLTGEQIQEEMAELQKGPEFGAIKNWLKQMLLKGEMDDPDETARAQKARAKLRAIEQDQTQIEAITRTFLQQKKVQPQPFIQKKA